MKKDVYQEITNTIIDALEHVDPEDFEAPFARLTTSQPPRNPTTDRYYHGINTLVLWLQQHEHGYQSNEWATYRQWSEQGVQVKKGEKSTGIVFFKQVEKKGQSTGGKDEDDSYFVARFYCVFNADQVEGYTPTTGREAGTLGTVEKIAAIETFVAATGADIREGDCAAFATLGDFITMPEASLFFENGQSATENYYAVLLHELTHWTGAKHRINRVQQVYSVENKEDYAFEELIAELGSAYLCAQFGIRQKGRDNHAMYIKSWLNALRSDKKYIFKAAAQAQNAVDYLHALSPGDNA